MRENQRMADLNLNNRSWSAYTRDTAARQAEVLPNERALPRKKTKEERIREERRKRWERNVRKHAIEREVRNSYTRSNGLSRMELTIIVSLLVMLLASCTFLLYQQSAVTASIRANNALEQKYQTLVRDNDILESTINMSINPEVVFKKATEEFGMGYPLKSQIIYYRRSEEGFVYQLEDIPE